MDAASTTQSERKKQSLPLLLIAAVGFAVLFLNACGNNSSSPPRDQTVLPLVEGPSKPVFFPIDDQACQSTTSLHELHNIQIFEWLDDQISPSRQQLDTPLLSDTSLRSEIIRKTVYGEIYSRDCDAGKSTATSCINENNHLSQWRQAQTGRGLKVCKDDATFKRRTLEQTALTSIYSIVKAYDAYRSHVSSRPSTSHTFTSQTFTSQTLEPMTLSIHPTWRSVFHGVTQGDQGDQKVRKALYLTNNAAFATKRNNPSGSTERMILIFPENEQSMLENTGFLWESNFVIAHEFGHYVEFSRQERIINYLGLTWSLPHHRFLSSAQSATSGIASEVDLLRAAISEAYADLLSVYTLRGETASLSGISCIGTNRNPTLSRFSDQKAKRLTTTVLGTLFALFPPTLGNSCEDANFSQPHTVGAVFAHTMYYMFNMILRAYDEPDESYRIRYRMALDTIDEYWRQQFINRPPTQTDHDEHNEQPIARKGSYILSAFAEGLTHAMENAIDELDPQNLDPSMKLEIIKDLCLYSKHALESLPSPLFTAGSAPKLNTSCTL